jgi:hypothetical protein
MTVPSALRRLNQCDFDGGFGRSISQERAGDKDSRRLLTDLALTPWDNWPKGRCDTTERKLTCVICQQARAGLSQGNIKNGYKS